MPYAANPGGNARTSDDIVDTPAPACGKTMTGTPPESPPKALSSCRMISDSSAPFDNCDRTSTLSADDDLTIHVCVRDLNHRRRQCRHELLLGLLSARLTLEKPKTSRTPAFDRFARTCSQVARLIPVLSNISGKSRRRFRRADAGAEAEQDNKSSGNHRNQVCSGHALIVPELFVPRDLFLGSPPREEVDRRGLAEIMSGWLRAEQHTITLRQRRVSPIIVPATSWWRAVAPAEIAIGPGYVKLVHYRGTPRVATLRPAVANRPENGR